MPLAEYQPPRAPSSRLSSALALVILLPAVTSAQSWEVIPIVGTEISYETNPDNASDADAEDDAYIVSAAANLRITRATQQASLYAEPEVRLRESFGNDGNSQLDGTDFLIPVTAALRGRRSLTSLGVGYTLLPSREADYQVVNPNEPVPPGGVGCGVDIRGRCRVDETQSRWYFNPGFSYSWSPRLQFSVSGGYSATRYDEAEITGRFDYDYGYASSSLSWSLNPQNRISVSANASRYTADQERGQLENTSETAGISLGYEYAISSTTSIIASGGVSASNITLSGRTFVDGLPCFDPSTNTFVLCETEGTDTNFVGELFLRQRLDQSITTQIGASRSIQPNSDGAETTVDTVSAYAQRDITSKLEVSAGVSYIDQEAVAAETLGVLQQRFDRTYYRLELGTSWRLTPRWTIRGQYNHYLDEQSVETPSGAFNQSLNIRNRILSLQVQYVAPGFR
jgi:hypothetical protein